MANRLSLLTENPVGVSQGATGGARRSRGSRELRRLAVRHERLAENLAGFGCIAVLLRHL
jgi:hypothetical protein